MLKRLVISLTTAFLFAHGAGTARAERYTVTDLGTLGGFHSKAFGINDLGQVVGTASLPGGGQHAFLWSGGTMTDLGTLGGKYSVAYGINNAGQVVGHSYTTEQGSSGRAFLHSGGTMTNLGTLGGSWSSALAINNAGQVVGHSWGSPSGTRAFRYDGGKMTPLGDFGGLSAATAINAEGQIAGYAAAPNVQQAFLSSGGTMRPLGALGTGIHSQAFGINNLGEVVGYSSTARQNGQKHAFVYRDGKMIDLGTLPGGISSEAYGINDGGLIVGTSGGRGWPPHAFLYRDGKMIDLNSLIPPESHLTLLEARGINSQGQIVGLARTADGAERAFLLTPVEVPEPGSLVLLGMGAAGLAGYTWRHRKRVTRRGPSAVACPAPGRAP